MRVGKNMPRAPPRNKDRWTPSQSRARDPRGIIWSPLPLQALPCCLSPGGSDAEVRAKAGGQDLTSTLLLPPGWLSGKESACQGRRCGFDPWVGIGPLEKANGNLLQYSCLGKLMNRGVWWGFGHGVTKESALIW